MINIAFCFDKNLWKNFCVSVSSLLINSNGKCHYNICCIISDDITDTEKEYMKKVINKYDSASQISFINANHDWDATHLVKPGYYYRMQLVNFTSVDKIIYCDVDTYFNCDLSDLYNIDMGNKLLYGVKDALNTNKNWNKYLSKTDNRYIVKQGNYINSGVLLMNLKLFRKENLYDEFLKLRNIRLKQKDQCMLNYVARGRVGFLPLKYNFKPKSVFHKYKIMVKANIFSRNELIEAEKFAPIWHFMASNPWKVLTKGAEKWWKICRQFDFYNEMRSSFMKQATPLQRLKFKIMEWNNF